MGIFEKDCCTALPVSNGNGGNNGNGGKPNVGSTNTIELYYGGSNSKTIYGKLKYYDSSSIDFLETGLGFSAKVKINPSAGNIIVDTAQGLRANYALNTVRFNIDTKELELYDSVNNTWNKFILENKNINSIKNGTVLLPTDIIDTPSNDLSYWAQTPGIYNNLKLKDGDSATTVTLVNEDGSFTQVSPEVTELESITNLIYFNYKSLEDKWYKIKVTKPINSLPSEIPINPLVPMDGDEGINKFIELGFKRFIATVNGRYFNLIDVTEVDNYHMVYLNYINNNWVKQIIDAGTYARFDELTDEQKEQLKVKGDPAIPHALTLPINNQIGEDGDWGTYADAGKLWLVYKRNGVWDVDNKQEFATGINSASFTAFPWNKNVEGGAILPVTQIDVSLANKHSLTVTSDGEIEILNAGNGSIGVIIINNEELFEVTIKGRQKPLRKAWSYVLEWYKNGTELKFKIDGDFVEPGKDVSGGVRIEPFVPYGQRMYLRPSDGEYETRYYATVAPMRLDMPVIENVPIIFDYNSVLLTGQWLTYNKEKFGDAFTYYLHSHNLLMPPRGARYLRWSVNEESPINGANGGFISTNKTYFGYAPLKVFVLQEELIVPANGTATISNRMCFGIPQGSIPKAFVYFDAGDWNNGVIECTLVNTVSNSASGMPYFDIQLSNKSTVAKTLPVGTTLNFKINGDDTYKY